MRHVALIALGVLALVRPVLAQDSDKLEHAFESWKTARKEMDKRMVQAFGTVEVVIKKNRALPPETRNRFIEELNAQQQRFKQWQTLPESDLMLGPTIHYLDALHTKSISVRRLYDQALEKSVGDANQFDKVAAAKAA